MGCYVSEDDAGADQGEAIEKEFTLEKGYVSKRKLDKS